MCSVFLYGVSTYYLPYLSQWAFSSLSCLDNRNARGKFSWVRVYTWQRLRGAMQPRIYNPRLPSTIPLWMTLLAFCPTMLTCFGANRLPLAFPSQGQTTGSEGVTTPSRDCIADLWPQFDRMVLTTCRRTPSSDFQLSHRQYGESQDSLDANTCSGNSFGHCRQELAATNRHSHTTEHLDRISTTLENVICDRTPNCQFDPPGQQSCACNRPSDQSGRVSTLAFRISPGQIPLSTLTRQHREELNRLVRDLQLDDDVITLPFGDSRTYAGKQNPVLKRIRLRRVSKKNSSRARKSISG